MAECEAARAQRMRDQEATVEFWFPVLGETSPLMRLFVVLWVATQLAQCVTADDPRLR